jgi:serine beta-lactamase-like protein LACTB, mitochondrial
MAGNKQAGQAMRTREKVCFRMFLLLFVLTAARARAQSPPGIPDETLRRAERAITASMAKQNVSGLSVAVVVGNELRWSQGYGFADLENFVPFTATTVWRLGSISKPITAVAAMQLAERGKLDLDAPIQSYCPAFPTKARPITSRQLLGHLSGIRHYRQDENFNSTRHFEGVVDSLEAFKADPLVHDPGAAFTYSTYGYVVLGCVIEGASGMKYADYVRDNVAKPAGMERTRPDDLAPIVPNRARGYAKQPSGELRNCDLADTSNKVPGGGMVSTAVDLGRFAVALDTGRLLQRQTFAQMQVPMKTNDGKDSPYFGWSISERRGEKLLTHGGSQQGTSTYLLMLPGRGFAVALIANTVQVDVGELAQQLTEILLP